MEAKAIAKSVRMSPRRARLVIDLVRGKSVQEAEAILKNQTQKAAKVIYDVLKSATANAENNLQLDPTTLYISHAVVDQGSTMKRMRFESRGHVGRKDHKTSHVTIVVAEKK